MTPAEFKAWFDGFTEGMDGPPSVKQWKKITDKVKSIDGTSVLTPIYVDRWWPSLSPCIGVPLTSTRFDPTWLAPTIVCDGSGASLSAGAVSSSIVRMSADDLKAQQITPTTASALLMAEGRADALAAA